MQTGASDNTVSSAIALPICSWRTEPYREVTDLPLLDSKELKVEPGPRFAQVQKLPLLPIFFSQVALSSTWPQCLKHSVSTSNTNRPVLGAVLSHILIVLALSDSAEDLVFCRHCCATRWKPRAPGCLLNLGWSGGLLHHLQVLPWAPSLAPSVALHKTRVFPGAQLSLKL